jgi:hypothetical protein
MGGRLREELMEIGISGNKSQSWLTFIIPIHEIVTRSQPSIEGIAQVHRSGLGEKPEVGDSGKQESGLTRMQKSRSPEMRNAFL